MKTNYTNFTPIPAQVPRQLAIEILQSHSEIITLNPLVLDHRPIKAPRDCPNDEYYSTWYEITQRIQFVPGLKKMGSSKVTFKGCFHDMPWGVQTHMYVPAGVDLRNKWQIRGSQPGEDPEPRELGSGAPSSGLYLREDVEIKCNPLALSFVKKEMKAAALTMAERMLKKAELLDAGVIQAMFENGKLKTFNPMDRSQATVTGSPQPPASPGQWRPVSMAMQSPQPSYQMPNQDVPNQMGQMAHPQGGGIVVEMPGDFTYYSQPPAQNSQSTEHSSQTGSDYSDRQTQRWSGASSEPQGNINSTNRNSSNLNPSSYSISNVNPVDANTRNSNPPSQHASPNPDTRRFTAELPGCAPTNAEAPKSAPPTQSSFHPQTYNPQNYARFAANGY